MVKSYQGEQVPQKKTINHQAVLVRDHMATNLVTFTADQSLLEAAAILVEKGFSGASVINAKNEPIGIISEGDCIKELINERYYNQPSAGGKVGDCMVTKVVHINGNVDIFEAARMFLNLRVRRFPVLDSDGKLIGQISQRDVLKAMQDLKGTTWHENQ